jgi:hypothetical protein
MNVKAQEHAWNALHKEGIKILTAAYQDALKLVGGTLDIINYNGRPNPEFVKAWHKTGNRIFCYGQPQGGVENPYAYRKGFGLKLWKLNVDGAMTYCYYHSHKHPYTEDGTYREMAMAYPTANGVIETIALAGYREAIDDIRYATLLKKLIRENINGDKEDIAIKAKAYLDNINNYDDLYAVRKEIINFILKLLKNKSAKESM